MMSLYDPISAWMPAWHVSHWTLGVRAGSAHISLDVVVLSRGLFAIGQYFTILSVVAERRIGVAHELLYVLRKRSSVILEMSDWESSRAYPESSTFFLFSVQPWFFVLLYWFCPVCFYFLSLCAASEVLAKNSRCLLWHGNFSIFQQDHVITFESFLWKSAMSWLSWWWQTRAVATNDVWNLSNGMQSAEWGRDCESWSRTTTSPALWDLFTWVIYSISSM